MEKILAISAVAMVAIFIAVFANYKSSHVSMNTIKSGSEIGVLGMFRCGSDGVCMDSAAESLLQAKSAKELLAQLDELGKKNGEVLLQCHPITHSIGRMLYKKLSGEKKNIGDAFQQCDHTCHSGCFHGAMERVFFSDDSIGAPHVTSDALREKVPTVCENFDYGVHGNIRFQCLHGLGHAVLFFADYNLTESLKICDLLSSQWDQTSCYGGTFMENVHAINKSKRYLTDSPHFPCNAVEENYKGACYIMQTTRMLELGLSYEGVAKECESAGDYRNMCMQSLGRDASNDARTNKSTAVCTSLSTEADRQYCITGLVYALSDNSWDGRYAFPYCDSLLYSYIEFCYKTTVSYLLNSLYISKATIINSCKAHSSYADCTRLVN